MQCGCGATQCHIRHDRRVAQRVTSGFNLAPLQGTKRVPPNEACLGCQALAAEAVHSDINSLPSELIENSFGKE